MRRRLACCSSSFFSALFLFRFLLSVVIFEERKGVKVRVCFFQCRCVFCFVFTTSDGKNLVFLIRPFGLIAAVRQRDLERLDAFPT